MLYVDLLFVALLVMINAALSGSEMALVSLREGQVRRLEERGGRGRAVAWLAGDPNRFLSTVQVGITLAGFLASATAAVSLAEPIAEVLPFGANTAEPIAVVLVTLALTFVTLVFGELAPKRLAMQWAEGWSLLAARPLSLMSRLLAPPVALLSGATNLVVRALGGDPRQTRQPLTEEGLRDMVAAQATLTPLERQVVFGALDIGERTLAQVLRPRADVFALDAREPAPEALSALLASGYSRAPVVEGRDLDDLVGIVHVRSLVGATGTAGEASRPPMILSDTLPALDALRRLQLQREGMALVLDQNQVVAGLVTVEDLVEEIVGEIYDEADRDIRAVEREGDHSFGLPGSFPMHDLVDLGIEVPQGTYSTVAGLILDQLAALPDRPGVAVTIHGWRFEVVELRGRRISWVRVTREGEPSLGDS